MTYQDIEAKDYQKFLTLYNSTFPEAERRPYTDEQHLATYIKMKGGKMHIATAKDGDEFVGFLSYWTFEGYVYIEHFAVVPEQRGRNIGKTLLNHVMNKAGQNVVVEVEHPDTDEAARRIKFYEGQGFKVRENIDYIQPAYGPGLPTVPMLLMTHGDVKLGPDCKELETMLAEVYEVNHGPAKKTLSV